MVQVDSAVSRRAVFRSRTDLNLLRLKKIKYWLPFPLERKKFENISLQTQKSDPGYIVVFAPEAGT